MSTIPRPKIIGAVFAAVALLLGFAAPAHADEAVLVSNIDEQDANTVFLNFYKLAQGFTTAGAAPYDLVGIEVHIANVPNGQSRSLVSASLRADDGTGNPASTSLCLLDIPIPWVFGIKRFGADNCAPLTANTHYFVVLDFLQPNNSFSVRLTNSDNQDASSALNWLIDDDYRYFDENDPNAGWQVPSTGRAAEIRVRAANTAPTATPPKKVNTDEDTAHTFSENDFGFLDADSDALDHVKITSLPKGTLSLDGMDIASASDTDPVKVMPAQLDDSTDDNLKYTPPPNEFSTGTPITDFTTFTFKVNDDFDDSAEATITITVNAVNDAPVVSGPSTLSVAENTDSDVLLAAYTATDQEGDSFVWSPGETLSGVDDTTEFRIVNGELFFASSRDFEDPEDEGTDNVYEVRVEAYDGGRDGRGGLDVTITVTDVEVAANDDTATTDEDMAVVIDVVANDTDDPDEPDDPWTLSVSGVGTPTAPSNGTVTNAGDGSSVTYTPTENFTGTDTFTYTVSNGADPPGTATGTVTVTVNAVNDVPVATADTPTTNEDQAVVIRVLENDTDVDGDTLTVTDVGTPANGAAKITGNSTTITYTPTAGYIGEDNFFYEISDGNLTSRSRVTVTVTRNADPTVEIIREATGPISGPFDVTVRFSEPVQGFTLEDIQVTNGTASNFAKVPPQEYTATITPEGIGEVRVEVAEDVAEDRAGNGNEAAASFEVEAKLAVRYEQERYTATEGEGPVPVTVTLSLAGHEGLVIPIRVTRPETTEVGDYTVEGVDEWDAQAGTGTLTFAADETKRTWRIAANHDGDGEDETVALGFGALPEIVLAGAPAVATVTLEDKGLVELQVSFGQAAYEVKEGQAAAITVLVSPAVDRRVDVPLVVALEGGATDEDYRGVPASVVFEAGESQRTMSVEVLADDVSDSGEGMVLSLGELPEAVSAGDPASTEVHFGQQRTAQQFTPSLEAMLAVMGRSMGESARTAIEGRFERYRQWSRLGSSGGALPPPLPGSDTSATALRPGAATTSAATGSEWTAEHRETGTPGSWLQSVLLGSLGNLVGAGQSASDITSGYGMAPVGSGDGEGRRLLGSGVGDALLEPGSRDVSEMTGQVLNLSGVSLEMSLGAREQATSWVPVVWGQGDLQHFNGDVTRIGMNYRGGLEAAHIGLDLYANDQMLAGLSFMRSWGDLEYTDDGIEGVLESRMNTVHPYLYWQPSDRVSVWGMGGVGQGHVEVTEPGRTHDFGADFQMVAGGVRSVLTQRGNHEWGLRADAFTTQLETSAVADITAVGGEAHRGRVMLDWVHDRALSVGRSLSVQAEAGGRFDGGDAEGGSGAETGFRLGYLDAPRGLDVALHGRVLVVHASDYRDWGVGAQASWDPGEKQRGFRVSVNSSRGQDGGGRTTLWDNAEAVTRPAEMGATRGIGSQSRMDSEVAYAGLKAPGVPGLLTPYSRLRWAGQGRELAWGTAWTLPTRSPQALPLLLNVETLRRETSTGPADLAVLAHMSIPF